MNEQYGEPSQGVFSMANEEVDSHAVTDKWLRSLGFTFHAIGKYYYMRTPHDTILVKQNKGHDDFMLSVVASHADPRSYADTMAVLQTESTREEVVQVVGMSRRCSSETEQGKDTGTDAICETE